MLRTACDVLTDEKKRKVYDKIGHGAYVNAVKRGEDPEQTMNDPFSHFTHGGHESFFSNAHEFFNNDDFFGGGPDLHRGGMFFSQNGAPMFQVPEQIRQTLKNSFKGFDPTPHKPHRKQMRIKLTKLTKQFIFGS